METKKVTSAEVEKLFAFTRAHFVEYYDLQAELADHLANAIEERWMQQPGLSFDEALHLEFKKFGIFGFSDIVEQRQNALFKRYYKLVWKELRSALTLPLSAIILLSGFALYKTALMWPLVFPALMTAFFVVSGIKLWQVRKAYKLRLKQTGKKWLLEEVIFNCGGFGILLYLPLQVSQHLVRTSITPGWAVIMAGIIVLLFFYDYIVLFRLPAKAEMHLKKVYPEYSLENSPEKL